MLKILLFACGLFIATFGLSLAEMSPHIEDMTDDDDIAQDFQSDDVEKRKTEKDLLSKYSCRFLKISGYFKKIPSLKKLCLPTFHCNDILSNSCCNIIKSRNDCKKNSKLSLVYCRFTCNKCYHCNERPLGMEIGAIPDSSITASSAYSSSYPPHSARLHSKKNNGIGWAPKTNAAGQWIQVDLGKVTEVTAVATQGRKVNGEWVKSYILQYSNDGKTFTNYQGGKVFNGNTDYNTVVKNAIKPPIYARYIRLVPKTYHNHKTMRMELYGCK